MATPEEPGARSPFAAAWRAVAARPRTVVVGAVALAVFVLGTAAVAKILHPDLASMPPVMRHPGMAVPPAPSSPSPEAGLPAVASASPTPSPSRSRPRRPSPTPSRSPSASPTPPLVLSFEAEAAQESGTRRRSVAAASGGVVIGDIDRYGNYVRFAISVPAAGRYTVSFHYVAGSGSRSAAIIVNSDPPTSRSFPSTGDWATVRALPLTFSLRAGVNTIMFAYVSGSSAPELDRITVTRS